MARAAYDQALDASQTLYHLFQRELRQTEQTMPAGKFVTYFRVSTDRQGKSGLGIEAQRASVSEFLNGGRWKVVAEFVEVESGKTADRPKLVAAIEACRLYGAKLCIAKLDRLSRDAHFLLGLEKAGVEFVCADMPSANRLTVGIMAMVAEEERRMISARTKAALQAASRPLKKLGSAPLGLEGCFVAHVEFDLADDGVGAGHFGRTAS